MKYTTNNVQVSLTLALAAHLRAHGYNVFWHATGETDAQSAGLSQAKGTVTLVPEFPANPTAIVRLKGDSTGAEEVVVPALTLHVLGSPTRDRILGLGHKDYEWERHFRIDGFAADEFQHKEMQDLLHDWLQSEEGKPFPVYDFAADPATPPALDPVRVLISAADRTELVHENEAVRYYVRATAVVTYIE